MIGRGATVAEALARPANGFTLLRLALALAVVVSHGFSVTTGRAADEPLAVLTRLTLGEHAVNGFFAVSGFLVTMSFDRRGARDYLLSRVLRIVPGFVCAVLVVALGIGAVATRLPLAEYLADPGLRRFLVQTLTTFRSNIGLPGVFADNPLTIAMGTVWTLRYEVFCYGGVLALGSAGLLRRRLALWLAPALGLALFATHLWRGEEPGALPTALRLAFLFAGGGALYLARERLRLSGLVALALLGLAALLVATPAYRPALYVAEIYGAIWIALHPVLARPALDPPLDLSYGTYLYGWPIQQLVRQAWPEAGTAGLLAPSLAATLAVAALSWFAVERPALRLKARRLGRGAVRTIEPAAP